MSATPRFRRSAPSPRSARRLRRPRSPTSADSERGTRTFRSAGVLGAAASFRWSFGPFSVSCSSS
eukprot:11108268-Alexandrium_andersonii.AAC.1